MPDAAPNARGPSLPLLVALLFAIALVLRVGVAVWLDHRNRERHIEHEFPDSELYWKLGLSLAERGEFFDGRRQAQRTPGYPLLLAGCIRLFGPSTIAARHAQAAIGAASCVLLFLLARRLFDDRTAWISAAAACVYPYAVYLSVVLLSEACFTLLLLAQLLLFARLLEALDREHPSRRVANWALLAGLAGAAATLVRPSWLLATPIVAIALVVRAGWFKLRQAILAARAEPNRPDANVYTRLDVTHSSVRACLDSEPRNTQRGTAAICLVAAFIAGMAPWWVRNWKLTEQPFVTTLWGGASLYDGLNPLADGSSRMDFISDPQRFGLVPWLDEMNEVEQDEYLRAQAWRFVRAEPRRVVSLATIKLARFWNPLPNAAEGQRWPIRLLSLLSSGPILLLALGGVWLARRRRRAVWLLAGPVLYFCLIHIVFVSSIRYREAAMLPVIGLAAISIERIANRRNPSAGSVLPDQSVKGTGRDAQSP